MKSKIIITAAAAAAGAALVTYIVRKMKAGKHIPEFIPAHKSHHRTEVFAHAKNHSDQ